MNKKCTLEDYLEDKVEPSTAANYLYTINHFLKVHPRARRYKYQDMVSYMAELTKQYPNPKTRKRVVAAVKKYYDYLVETGQREENPLKTLTVKASSNHSIQLQDLFTTTELEALMQRENRYKHLDIRNKVIISLLIYQGLTSDEVVRLDVDNIDLDMGTVYIKKSPNIRRRILELRPKQVKLLYDYINETRPKLMWRGRSNKLIINKLGQPLSADGINAMLEPLGVIYPDRPLNPRSIRMSVISNWLNEKKLPLENVQELAGHKWPSTTEKYIRLDDLKQRELINKFFPL